VTPFGRFRYLRLPFGIKSAPEVYQYTVQELFSDLPSVEFYFDDFMVWGETKQELEERLEAVFRRCEEVNLRLNLKKVSFFPPEYTLVGTYHRRRKPAGRSRKGRSHHSHG